MTSSPVPQLVSSSPSPDVSMNGPMTRSGSLTPLTPTLSEKELFNLEADKKLQRLKFLVEKSKIYSSILTERLNENTKRRTPKKKEDNSAKKEDAKEEENINEEKPIRRSSRRTAARADVAPESSKRAKRTKTAERSDKSGKMNNQSILSFTRKDIEKVAGNSKASVGYALKQVSHETQPPSTLETLEFEQPRLLTGGQLLSYQLAGVEWMISLFENGLNGILADEMGLGKTIQTIAFLAYLIEHEISGPFLIVAPLSTIDNWCKELEKFAPSLKFVKYHGTPDERGEQRNTIKQLSNQMQQPIVITSYEIIIRDAKFLGSFLWKYVIVDEGHRLKNMNCRLIKELKKFDSANRLLLTGTPLQNNLAELWSLLNFLLPDIFADLDLFQAWFESSGSSIDEFGEETNSSLISSLHAILRPFLLRRIKSDVEKFLPPKREYVIYCSLTDSQTTLYQRILDRTVREYVVERILQERGQSGRKVNRTSRSASATPSPLLEKRSKKQISYADVSDRDFFKSLYDTEEDITSGSEEPDETELMVAQANRETSRKSFQNLMMQLRLACNSPYLFYYPWTVDDSLDNRIVTQSGKMILLDKLCGELIKGGHKILIFSQFTKMLDILQDWLYYLKKWKFCRIDGSTAQVDRQQEIEVFNKDPSYKVFLLSTRSGGLGINLTAADTVILFDSDWNPQQDLQAMDRVHRIGQTRPVIVYRLATAGTVEEKLLERASSKRRLEHLVIERGRFKGFSNGLEHEVLEQIGKDLREVQAKQKEGIAASGSVSEHDFKEIMDRSEEAYERARNGKEELSDNIVIVN